MHVLKFGGTAVAHATDVRRAVEIIQAQDPARVVVVISAHAGVTDALLEQAERAVQGNADLSALRCRHSTLIQDLHLDVPEHESLFGELQQHLQEIRDRGQLSLRDRDAVVAYGERLAAHTLAAALRDSGTPAQATMADAAGLETDSRHGAARPLRRCLPNLRHSLLEGASLPVVTGFLGRNAAGHVTTLGRNGSDATAAVVARALGAPRIQIWTDVAGVSSADPHLVEDTVTLEALSYDEADLLARLGARVLSPDCIQLAREACIGLQVQSVREPGHPGTSIGAAGRSLRSSDLPTAWAAVMAEPASGEVHLVLGDARRFPLTPERVAEVEQALEAEPIRDRLESPTHLTLKVPAASMPDVVAGLHRRLVRGASRCRVRAASV